MAEMIAVYKGEIIEREPISMPKLPNGKYNTSEMIAFWHRVVNSRNLSFDNSRKDKIEFYTQIVI